MTQKRPWVIALINAFPLMLGLGYFFIRLPDKAFLTMVLQILLPILLKRLFPMSIMNMYSLALLLYVIVDGYQQTKAYNLRLTQT
jgi:hypothetical protein